MLLELRWTWMRTGRPIRRGGERGRSRRRPTGGSGRYGVRRARCRARAVHGDGLEGVRRAARVVAADLAVERADREPPRPDEADEEVLHDELTLLRVRGEVGTEGGVRRLGRGRERTDHERSTTRELSSAARCSRVRCRSRLFTRLRVAALPTALLDREPHLRRRRRGVAVHPQVDHEGRRAGASPLTHRAAEAVSGGEAVDSGEQRRVPRALAVRRPGSCGPCGDGPTGWRDRHGSACAGGSRAPCDGDGCSAGTYACSRLFLRRFRGMSTPHGVGAGRSTGTARPRGRQVADRGHAAPVDGERPANGTRRANGGSNPRAAGTGRPVDDILLQRLHRLLRSGPPRSVPTTVRPGSTHM